nr:uORF1 [Mus musculus]AAW65482.1 uORF1 [Mus sp.]
MDSLDC